MLGIREAWIVNRNGQSLNERSRNGIATARNLHLYTTGIAAVREDSNQDDGASDDLRNGFAEIAVLTFDYQ